MHRILRLAACLLVLLAFAPAAAFPAAIPVHGRVTGPGGEPLPGARALLVPMVSFFEYGRLVLEGKTHPEPAASASADADGAFHLAAPEPGMWRVLVEAKGFVPMEQTLEPMLEETELPTVRLERDAGLQVRVTGQDGRPLAGARVRVAGDEPGRWLESPWRIPTRIALTDQAGLAVLPRASGERLNVRAGAAGHAPVGPREVSGGAMDLRLAAGRMRDLEVWNAAGRPLPGVVVRLGKVAWPVGRTSEAGILPVPIPEEGERDLLLTAEDGRVLETVLQPPAREETGPQRLTLPDAETLPGKVVSAVDGRPLAGALVWLSRDPGAFRKTGPTGDFRLPVIPGKDASVGAAAAGFFPADVESTSRPGRARRAPTLALEPALSVSGRVVDERGQGVPGVEIDAAHQPGAPLRSPNMFRSGGTLRSDPAGRFRIRNLAAEVGYRLRLSKRGFAPAEAEIPPLAPGRPASELRIVMRQGRAVFGRVLSPSQEPVAGARVTLRPAPSADLMTRLREAREPRPGYEAATNAGGRFEIADLPAGSFDLVVRGRGYAPLTVPGLSVPQGKGETDLGTVMLAPGVALEGFVVDAQGRPVEGAEVRVQEAGSTDRFAIIRDAEPGPPDALTGLDGSFTVEDRRASETVDVTASREGYVPGKAPGVQVPAEQPVRLVLQPASAVLGRVVGPDGKPIPQARVIVEEMAASNSPGLRITSFLQTRREITDQDGSFRIGGVAPGPIQIRALARGWQSAELANLEVPAGRDLKGVEIVLQPGARIEGQVLSPARRPVPGARVSLLQPRSGGVRPRAQVGGMTDGEGRYLLEGVPPGAHSVAVEHGSYQRTVRDLDVRMGDNTLDITLEGGNQVSGRVVDESGAPVANVRIALLEGVRFANPPEGMSGPDGAFEISGVPDGTYRILADKEGYATRHDREPVTVAGASVTGLELRLSRGGSIVGQLSGLGLAELARVRVWARSEMSPGRVTPEGTYRIDNLEPGDWLVIARVPGTPLQTQGRVTLEPGAAEARLDLEFGGGLTLSGRVLRNGGPAAGQGVRLVGGAAAVHEAETDHEGRFRFGGLEAGSYELVLSSLRGEVRHRETLEIAADREVLIELRTADLAGRVLDSADSSPISGAAVTLVPVSGAGEHDIPAETRTDSRGAFRLVGVAEGTWKVQAVAEGYGPGEVDVTVGGVLPDDLDLRLQATEGLTLEALLPSGRPPGQVSLAVLDTAGRSMASGTYPVGENGRVRVSSVPPGTWEIVLDAPEAAPAVVSVTAPGHAGRVVLPPAGALRVRVPGLASDRTAATVTLTGADGRPFRLLGWNGGVRSSFDLHGGIWAQDRLPVGSWEVRVSTADGRSWTGRATVTPGGMAEVVWSSLERPPRLP